MGHRMFCKNILPNALFLRGMQIRNPLRTRELFFIIFVSNPLDMSAKERLQEELLVEDKQKQLSEIVLFNDEVNTFDHVIQTLIDVCEHTPEQAEQCSLIVHHNGKCTVKTGEFNDLKPRCTRLLQAGLSAEIV